MYDARTLEMVRKLKEFRCPSCGFVGTCRVTTVLETTSRQYDYQCSSCKHSGTIGEGATKNPIDTWQKGLRS